MRNDGFKFCFAICLILSFLIFISTVSADMNSSNYNIKSSVTSNVGGNSTSSNFISRFIMGIISGNIISETYKNFVGFFHSTVTDIVFPRINFTSPTPNTGSALSGNSVFVNVSASDDSYVSSFIDFDSSLVSWWRMDDLNSSNGVVDYTGRNNGSVFGGAVQTESGKMGKAFDFDGVDDRITTPTSSSLSLSGSNKFTYSVWVKRRGTTGNNQPIGTISSTNAFTFQITNAGVLFAWLSTANEGWHSAGSGPTLTNLDGVWHNFVITYNNDTNTVKYYSNGTEVYSNSALTTGNLTASAGSSFWITQENNNYFNGSMDDAILFNRTLNSSEILALYANTSAKYYNNNFISLSDGNHTFKAYVQDLSGNVNFTEMRTVSTDSVFPIVNFTNPTPANGTIQNSNSILVNVSASDSVNNISSFIDFDNSLVSWWRMDDANSSTVFDYTGRNNGTAASGAVQNSSGKLGKSFSFDGINGYIIASDSSSLYLGTADLTFSAWVYHTNYTYPKTTFNMRKSSPSGCYIDSNRGFEFGHSYSSTGTQFCINNGTAKVSTTVSFDLGSRPTDFQNRWVHLVYNYDRTNGKFKAYVDGVKQSTEGDISGVTGSINNSGSLDIGTLYGWYLQGSIDDVMIFNRSLSSGEIVALYANTTSKYYSNNFTSLAGKTYNFKAYAQDIAGNVNFTELRTVIISLPPTASSPILNSTDGTNHTNQNLTCYTTIQDPEGNSLNVSVGWYKNNVLNLTLDYNNSYVSGTPFNGSLYWFNTTIGSTWKCSVRLFDGTSYSDWSNSSNLTILTYSTSLDAFDKESDGESNPQSNDIVYTNEWTTFYANYSSNATNRDIRAYIWNTSDLGDVFTTKEIDLDGDGRKNDVIIGEGGDIYGYYYNGTRKWTSALPSSNVYEIGTIDKENDGVEEIVVADYDGYARVYNISGTQLFASSDVGSQFYSVAAGDLDDDGFKDDFVIAGAIASTDWGLVAFTYNGANWVNVWNATQPISTTYEVKLSEITGESNLVGVNDGTGGRVYVYNASTGVQIWNVTSDLGTSYTLEFIDLDHDGKKDEVAFGASGNVYYYWENGTQIRQLTQTLSAEFEILAADLDNDGWEDDVFIAENYGEAWGFNETGGTLWRFTEPQEANQHWDPIYYMAANIKDVDNDGSIDIVFGGYSRTLWILNRTGGIIGRQYVGFETSSDGGDYIGATVASRAISFLGDINDDGIEDFAYLRAYGYVYTGQQALCKIYFNDDPDVEYMIYNITSGLHEYYRFFNETGFDKTTLSTNDFTWNVTCSKGGYDTQTVASKDITVYLQNASIETYDLEDDNENKAGWLSEETVYTGLQTYFFANFTDFGTNRSVTEIGFKENFAGDLGDDVVAVAFADLNRDGVKDEIVVAESEDLYGYYANGTRMWTSTIPSGTLYEIAIGDLNNDSFENEIVMTESGDYVRVFNRTGGQVWNSGDIGDATYSVEVGDLDKDGIKDDIVVGYDNGPGFAIAVYNTSDGVTWQHLWNYSDTNYIGDAPYEVAIGLINSSNTYNYVGVNTWSGGRALVLYSHNGSLVFTPMADLGTVRSLEFVDLDHDGDENEVILGEDGDLFAYNEAGTLLWQATEPGTYTYETKKIDLDNDGFKDDVVIADYRYVMGFNETGKRIFLSNLTMRYLGSIEVADIDNDGQDEILAGGEEDAVYIFNKSASVVGKYYTIPGNSSTFNRVGLATSVGSSTGIAVGKSNTTTYLAIAGEDVATYILKAYTNCLIGFNDSVSAQMRHNNSFNSYYYNRSFANSGSYTWNVTCEAENYIISSGNTLNISVSLNSIPYNGTALVLNSTLGLNRTLEDLNVRTTLLDQNSDKMNVTVMWYNNSILYKMFMYNNSYSNGTTFIATLGNGNTTKGQNWSVGLIISNARNSFNVNSSNLTILNTPPNTTLSTPINGTYSTARINQTFTWASSDADGDSIIQDRINITLIAGSTCTDTSFDGTDVYLAESLGTYSINNDNLIFNCLIDNNDYYKWSVSASDGIDYGSWTAPFNLSIQAYLDAPMNISLIEFGSLGYLGNNDTSDNSPKPFIIVNEGNVLSDIDVIATSLWQSVTELSSYYKFKFDNVTTNGISENGTFNWSGSQTTYVNMPIGIVDPLISVINLNYSDSTDSAEIDINVTVPATEGPGARNSVVTFTISLGTGDTY